LAGIVGTYCADGRPADVSEVRRMADAVAHRGLDGIAYWSSGPVAFAHLQFCTTPESLEERQPLVSAGGEACLVWDGRIDNREELLDALVAQGARPVDNTDPGLVLAAYLLWGTECVERLVGDFALAIWDARVRRLWCARDYVGIRPFYYYWDGKTFLFGPELCALLAHPLVSMKINEGMVGEYFMDAVTSREETLYCDVRRLPSGSTLTIDAAGELRISSWWNPELSLIEYGTDEEYAEQFLHLMEQSVLSRMRSNAWWGCDLSGGLDSSTIAVTSQALLDRGRPGDASGRRRALTFSMACRGKPWDESEYIEEIAEFSGLQSERLSPFRANLAYFRRQTEQSLDFPGYPNGPPMFVPIVEAIRRHGIRVLLNGVGGNEWLEGTTTHLFDLARAGAIRPMLDRARDDWELYGGSRHWSNFLLRRLVAGAAPDWAHRRRSERRFEHQRFFSREFLRRTCLADRLSASVGRESYRYISGAQEAVFQKVIGGGEANIIELDNRDSARAGIEARYPFFDRRLGEFCLRLPENQRQRGTVWKWVLRNAMRGRLPERVRMKTIQAEFSELFDSVLYDPSVKIRLENSTILKHTDWLNPEHFAARVRLPTEPSLGPSQQYWPAWIFLGVDLWLENVLSRGGIL
jgi:asparagine synthase (glutamine-hydrolysing)